MDYKCNSKVSISGSLHVIPNNGSVGNPFISFNKRSHLILPLLTNAFKHLLEMSGKNL